MSGFSDMAVSVRASITEDGVVMCFAHLGKRPGERGSVKG